MGERKILNKYIPSDFDPTLIPKLSSTKAYKATQARNEGKVQVRMMIPFSMQCNNCGTFMYRGKKFNSLKEDCLGPSGKYLGIQRYRFYIKCVVCSRGITFKTDPENGDYEMESGASRNYEVWKDKEKHDESQDAEEEDSGAIEQLEKRVSESRREMEEIDRLEEIKELNARHVRMSDGEILGRARGENEKVGEEEDEEVVKNVVFGIRRLEDSDEEEDVGKIVKESFGGGGGGGGEKRKAQVLVVKKKKRKVEKKKVEKKKGEKIVEKKEEKKKEEGGGGLGGLLGGYGSDSS
ncbi:hypothetical protein TrVE_jg480 [Triparma verrucosa]|uniref:Splicing factor YJU2 n=1 Tax=Triparma verrucosa TaxID=1606542 RepID=A0A9W7EVM3_9STRA|nr:hypothetical protein TrVE_jg480 [Triparma verrucosa]